MDPDVLRYKFYGQPYMPATWREATFVVAARARAAWRGASWDALLAHACVAIVGWWAAACVWRWLLLLWGYGPVQSYRRVSKRVGSAVFRAVLALPPLRRKVDAEVASTTRKIEEALVSSASGLHQFAALPPAPMARSDVMRELEALHALPHTDWARGRVSGAVYHGGDALLALQAEAYLKNSVANQLHPDVFPGVRKMEAEVVSMVLRLFHGDTARGFCGSTTSGGTESLLLASLAAREYAHRHRGVARHRAEIIAPATVHAGIEKACFYFGMTLHKVALDSSYRADLAMVRRLINANTVLLVGSAPNFPHGIIDDIEGLSSLALKHNIPLHVDACLGSFIVTFMERAGHTVPRFDFRVPGVTSISCDTHKYGFAPKGSSIVMYRSESLRECQYYISTDWTGGMYGSPTLAGSRPGALMAGCWATMVSIGEEGYTQSCREIVSAAMTLKNFIRGSGELPELTVIGDPLASVVAFRVSDEFANRIDIYSLGDALSKKGWHYSTLQSPAALHFAFTRLSAAVVKELMSDLVDTVKALVAEAEAAGADHQVQKSDTGALYGVAGSVQTAGVADRLVVAFLNTLYRTSTEKACT
ncbi:sphinganine-1-phosphate aldolase [[Candida] zeylanoides]